MKDIVRKFTCGHPEQMIKPTVWLFLESFAMGFPAIATYFAINYIVEAFTSPVDINALWVVAAVIIALSVLQFVISTLTFVNTFLPTSIHSAENKQAFVKKLRTLPLGYFLKKKSGELINTFTGDFLAVDQSMVGMFTGIWSVVFAAILTGVFLFLFNPAMAAALYLCLPVSILIIVLSMRLNSRLSKRNLDAKDHTATYLNEYLLGMKTLKAYNQTGEGFCKLKNAYHHLMKVNLHAETIGGTLLSLATTLIQVGLPLMCFVGAYLILGGRLSIADYLGLIIIGTKVLSPLLTWVRYMVMLRTHYLSACRIDDVMQTPSMPGTDKTSAKNDIQFNDVSFSYNEKAGNKVLNNVSFTIKAGKLTAVVGPSGGGKSTILRLIARFWDVNKGEITCGDKALSTLNPDEWLQNISMVLQDVYLFHDTIRENILFGRKDVTESEMIEAAKRAQCHEFIMALPNGYDTVVGEGGNTLSGGEKQRISIARALLKDAPILLLDEPTASLDAKNEVLIQCAINQLVQNRTVVMIAHRLKTVQNADQILVVNQGSVEEVGLHKELLSQNGLYAKLWNMQQNALGWRFETQQ